MSFEESYIPIAFSLNSSPNRYALLVGSGISRDAGILTGWEITDSIIKKIASVHPSEATCSDSEKWYEETFGRPATFSGLFEHIGDSDEDRTAAFKQYFENIDDDGNQTRINPTNTHKVIAKMVKDKRICIIITTNFDDLLEQALRNIGIQPTVITENSSPSNMVIAGDHCRIIKINGDYPNNPLKLTKSDLSSYSPPITEYLHQIFSEYGLIICGWSGEHDLALREILDTDRIHRFSIYWTYLNSISRIPEDIRKNLGPIYIQITSSDEFLSVLTMQIEELSKYSHQKTITIDVAKKKIKNALQEPRPDIIIRDLIQVETSRVLDIINQKQEFSVSIINGSELVKNRLKEIDRIAAPLAGMVTTITAYDEVNQEILSETIEQLINLPIYEQVLFSVNGVKFQGNRNKADINKNFQLFRYYPAFLAIFGSGIISIAKRNFSALNKILSKPLIYRGYRDEQRSWYYDKIGECRILLNFNRTDIELDAELYQNDPYFYGFIIPALRRLVLDIVPNEQKFLEYLDIFEYFISLKYLDIHPELNCHLNCDNTPPTLKTRNYYSSQHGMAPEHIPVHIIDFLNLNHQRIESELQFNIGLSLNDLIVKHRQLLE